MATTFLRSAALLCILVPVPLAAEPNAGAYLAGNAAAAENDFESAAAWFDQALVEDPLNPALVENFLASRIGAGAPGDAVEIARNAVASGIESQLANMIIVAEAAKTGDWTAIFEALEAGHEVGPLVDGLTRGWARMGLGNMDQALAAFDEVVEAPGLRPFGLYHKALALATVGDFQAAEAILSMSATDGIPLSRRGVIARVEVLSQLDRQAEAVALLDSLFGPRTESDPGIATLRARLDAGESIPFDVVTDPRAGMAEVYYTLASNLDTETPRAYVLLYARIAQSLKPDDGEIAILVAGLLEELGNYDLAARAFALVPQGDATFHAAELGRAEVLGKAGQTDLSIEVLQQLIRTYPDLIRARIALADTLRQDGRNDAAYSAYSGAIERMPEGDNRMWFVLYMRAVCAHRIDDWSAAEADLRAALNLKPDQPQVLNYLGYSLLERGENLDEALGMIETAVDAQPDSGAIVDSLGWAYYVLGRAAEAVEPMERAAELEPLDPVINDHLGDVYWSVGRTREARFQWHRALSFDPEPTDATRIRLKLDLGLDEVLALEAANSDLSIAQDL